MLYHFTQVRGVALTFSGPAFILRLWKSSHAQPQHPSPGSARWLE